MPADRTTTYLVGAAAAAAAGLATYYVVRRVRESEVSGARVPPIPSPNLPDPAREVVLGTKDDPAVRQGVAQLTSFLAQYGVSAVFPVWDLVYLHNVKKYAIPPSYLWGRMAATLYYIGRRLKSVAPSLYVRNGYRPPWYNAQVNGAPNSQHLYFSALDLKAGKKADIEIATKEAARIYIQRGDAYRMGFGVYGTPASRIHVDMGWKRRTWEHADAYLSMV